MRNKNDTAKSARAIGVLILVLSSVALGQYTGSDTLNCFLKGEGLTYRLGVDPIFTITATPIITGATGGGTKNFGQNIPNTYTCGFSNLSAPWYGKIKVVGIGYTVKLDSIKVIPANLRGRVAFSNDTLWDSSMVNKKINLYFTATKITTSIKETSRVIPAIKENDRSMFFDLSGRKILSARVSALTVSKNQTRLIGLLGKR